MIQGYTFRIYHPGDLPRLQEITESTFGPVSIDKNMEEILGPFGSGDWASRKSAAIGEDCRIQPDGVFVAEHESSDVVGVTGTQ